MFKLRRCSRDIEVDFLLLFTLNVIGRSRIEISFSCVTSIAATGDDFVLDEMLAEIVRASVTIINVEYAIGINVLTYTILYVFEKSDKLSEIKVNSDCICNKD